MKLNERGGGGVAMYLFTTFIIIIMMSFMAAFILIKQADAQKQHAQVLLHHALNDAARTTIIIPSFDIFTGQLTSEAKIPPDAAMLSFCSRVGDGISLGSLTDLSFDGAGTDPSDAECSRIANFSNSAEYLPLVPNRNERNPFFPKGIRILEFKVVNTPAEAVNVRNMKKEPINMTPPFIYAKIAIPFSYTLFGKEITQDTFGGHGIPVEAVVAPNLYSNLDQNFFEP